MLYHNFFLVSCVLLLLYCLSCVIYRVFLSPLRHVPGPFLGKFSIAWQLWHLFKRDYHVAVQEAHKKYGSCVRVSHYEVSVTGPDVVKDVLLKPLDKHDWYKIFAMPDSSWPNLMSETNARKHIQMQKKTASGYTLSRILKSEPKIDDAINLFTSQIEKIAESKEPILLDKWFTYFSFDIVGEITFSKSFGFLQQGKDIGGCVATSHKLVNYLAFMAYFRQVHEFIMTNPLVVWLDLQPMRHVMDTTICAVRQHETDSNSNRIDMLEAWKSHKSTGPLTERELLAAANANVAAGADTVGCELQAFVYYVLRTSNCLNRLLEEIDNAVLKGQLSSPVQYEEAQKLPFFQACIKETYRFHPVSAQPYPRVAPKEGIEISGQFLTAGTIVSVNAWTVHRDESVFGKDATEFMPDRWLQPDSKSLERHLITFGAGYMSCPGKALAHMQLSKLLCTLFLKYDIEITTPKREWLITSTFLARPHSWSVDIKKRQSSDLQAPPVDLKMSSMKPDEYLLARGYLQSSRLNLQFYLWKEAVGYNLHPSIPVPKSDWKIADVGTGTGIWICELAKDVPESTSLHGFDISSQQFPHTNSLPKNVILTNMDATKPPPENLCGTYDVVHVRLLFSIIDNGDPSLVLNHCMKLLKPGGYLQWDEMDTGALKPVQLEKPIPSPCLASLANIWKFTKPVGWIPKLPEIFQQNGLSVVSAESHREKQWQRHLMMELWCLIGDEHASALEQMHNYEQAEKVKTLVSGAYSEIKKGALYTHTIRIAVGKTPFQE